MIKEGTRRTGRFQRHDGRAHGGNGSKETHAFEATQPYAIRGDDFVEAAQESIAHVVVGAEMAGDVFEEDLFLCERVAEIDEESRAHVTLQVFHLRWIAWPKAACDKIAVLQQATATQFFRCTNGNEPMMEVF